MFESGAKLHVPQKNPGPKLPIKRPSQGNKMRRSWADAAVKVSFSGTDAMLSGIAGFSCIFVEISCKGLQARQSQ